MTKVCIKESAIGTKEKLLANVKHLLKKHIRGCDMKKKCRHF